MEETLEFTPVCRMEDLVEGQMRAVEISGKRVLLAVVEGVPYALGAVCTHERSNLDEGTLIGHEVYCPLHFSCFDIRTGEALAPPADRATTVYAVRVQDGDVRVSTVPVDPQTLSAASETADDVSPAATTNGAAPDDVPAPDGPGVQARRPSVAAVRETTAHGRLLARAEDLPGLAAGAEALGTALRPVRESRIGGRLFDLLHGRVAGHALHPAVSDLPIGLWVGALLLDIIGRVDAGTILAGAGVAAGLATAATGVADWTVSDGRDRRVGLLHGILQTVALVIVCGSVVVRLLDVAVLGQVLLAIGLIVSMASAYLGGHLVLGRGVMVDHTAWIRGPRAWTRAIAVADLTEGHPSAVAIEGRQVLVSMIDGTVSAMENACTHAGGPLSLGPVVDGVVKCPWHGSCFRLCDGAVVKGPASHPQPMLDARVRDGWIEVRGRGRW